MMVFEDLSLALSSGMMKAFGLVRVLGQWRFVEVGGR